jgi:hypothetical protein
MFTGSITFIGKDIIYGEFGTHSGGAAFFQNMSLVFIPEIAQGCKDRIGSCLPQTTKRSRFDILS